MDIISVATLSETPLVEGANLQEGQHLDLVGAYRPTMREADDQCLLKSTIYVDSKERLGTSSFDEVYMMYENDNVNISRLHKDVSRFFDYLFCFLMYF